MSKILVVDDEAKVCKLLERFLEAKGYEVVTASNGIEALVELKNDLVDPIISDVLMPGMDGFEFCRECKTNTRLRMIPFIFYTASYISKKDEEFALSLGAEKFIVKPLNLDKLLKILEATIKEPANRASGTLTSPIKGDKEYFAGYSKRLVEKLENKILVLGKEVDRRKRLEGSLCESERRLKQAEGIASLGHWELNQISNTLYWSDEIYRIFNLKPQEFKASYKGFLDMVHPEDKEFVDSAYNYSLKNKTPYDIVHRLLLKDGTIKYVNEKCETEYDENDNPIRSLGIIQDITERKQLEDSLKVRACQQEIIASLGHEALLCKDLTAFMNEAVKSIANVLDNEYCKVLELLPGGRDMLLRAGFGWKEGLVGHATVGIGPDSQAGYTLHSSTPVIVEDMRIEKRFSGPPLLHEHNVVSGMSVIIEGQKGPWGVLGTHTTQRICYSKNDINFIQAVANILADVVAREQDEKALKESEYKYRKVIEAANDAIFIADANTGIILDANLRAGQMIGLPVEKIIGMHQSSLHLPEDVEQSKKVFQEHVCSENAITENMFVCNQEGVRIPIEISASVFELGSEKKILGIFRDITKRKKDEAALQASEERLRSLSKASFEGIVFHRGGVIIDCNEQFADLVGYGLDELIKMDGLELIHPEDRELARRRIATENEEDRDEIRLLCKNGSKKFVEARAQMLTIHGERIRVVAFRDITKIKQDAESLRESEERYRILVSSVKDYAIFMITPDGIISSWNEGVKQIKGYSADEIIGKHISVFYPEEDIKAGKIEYELQKAKEVGEYEDEGWRVRKDGSLFWANVVTTALFNNGELLGYTKVTRDFTERKKAEELLQEQKKTLEQKNIALSEVLGQIEIEKKQIKDNVIANAENLLLPIVQKLRLKGESRKYVQLLQRNIQDLTSSFGPKLTEKRANLSTREIEVCNMIKNGLVNKEIASLLNISLGTTEKHRNNIRKKLHIVNKDINLSSFLNSL